MKEEIKEILELYKEEDIEYYNAYSRLKVEDILDYITNLQEENERLNKLLLYANDEVVSYANACIDLKGKIDKAIEWCECVINAELTYDKLPNGKYTDMGYCLDLAVPLLNILQGEDTKESEVK